MTKEMIKVAAIFGSLHVALNLWPETLHVAVTLIWEPQLHTPASLLELRLHIPAPAGERENVALRK